MPVTIIWPSTDVSGTTCGCIRCAWANLQQLNDAYLEAFRACFEGILVLDMEDDNDTPPADVTDKTMNEFCELWKKKRRLKNKWRKARVKVANLEFQEEKRLELEEAEKKLEGEVAEQRMNEKMEELEGHALPPWKTSLRAAEPLEPAKKMETKKRSVSFMPGVFDHEAGGGRSAKFISRHSTLYQPGAYAGKEYIDYSGYFKYPEDFYAGNSGCDPAAVPGEHWAEYTPQWIADPSTYITPALILTDEVGNTRTLVRATLPKRRQQHCVYNTDPSFQHASDILVTSARIVSEVQKFLQRPKTRAKQTMMEDVKVFEDEDGIERGLYWQDNELHIWARRGGEKEAAFKVTWKDCLKIARNARRERIERTI